MLFGVFQTCTITRVQINTELSYRNRMTSLLVFSWNLMPGLGSLGAGLFYNWLPISMVLVTLPISAILLVLLNVVQHWSSVNHYLNRAS